MYHHATKRGGFDNFRESVGSITPLPEILEFGTHCQVTSGHRNSTTPSGRSLDPKHLLPFPASFDTKAQLAESKVNGNDVHGESNPVSSKGPITGETTRPRFDAVFD